MEDKIKIVIGGLLILLFVFSYLNFIKGFERGYESGTNDTLKRNICYTKLDYIGTVQIMPLDNNTCSIEIYYFEPQFPSPFIYGTTFRQKLINCPNVDYETKGIRKFYEREIKDYYELVKWESLLNESEFAI